MTTTLLVSELLDSKSVFSCFEEVFNKEIAINSISSAQDVKALLEIDNQLNGLNSSLVRVVNIDILSVHSKVVKPFVNKTTVEDDFI